MQRKLPCNPPAATPLPPMFALPFLSLRRALLWLIPSFSLCSMLVCVCARACRVGLMDEDDVDEIEERA